MRGQHLRKIAIKLGFGERPPSNDELSPISQEIMQLEREVAQQATFPFFSLPREIRDLIYAELYAMLSHDNIGITVSLREFQHFVSTRLVASSYRLFIEFISHAPGFVFRCSSRTEWNTLNYIQSDTEKLALSKIRAFEMMIHGKISAYTTAAGVGEIQCWVDVEPSQILSILSNLTSITLTFCLGWRLMMFPLPVTCLTSQLAGSLSKISLVPRAKVILAIEPPSGEGSTTQSQMSPQLAVEVLNDVQINLSRTLGRAIQVEVLEDAL